ncbi:MAG: glycosyltransferase [Alphaproteobacteria bacterium]|nr:glycosyltransferase [Alphaproteobacteria bacterium]
MTAPGEQIIAVVVTYGDRESLLRQTLQATLDEGVGHCVLVDNGSTSDFAFLSQPRFAGWLTRIRLDRNTGSAVGFRVGMEVALRREHPLILLLDHDNVLTKGCVSVLFRQLTKLQSETDTRPIAVLAYRPTVFGSFVSDYANATLTNQKSSFLGFNYSDLPKKLRKRRLPALCHPELVVPRLIARNFGPYGGMLFYSCLIPEIGLPNSDFVLYSDDYEFTNRIALRGGGLWLVMDAVVNDVILEERGISRSKLSKIPLIGHILTKEPDSSVYYLVRNSIFFERHVCKREGVSYWINATIYLIALIGIALICGKKARAALLARATLDGFYQKLGTNIQYLLH